MKKSRRTEKVASLLKNTIGKIVTEDIADTKIGIVTITDVEITTDLSIAKVYFSLIGGEKDREKQKNILFNMHKFIRKKIAERISLRYTPKIFMIYDDTPEKAQALDRIFRKIRD